MLGQGDAPVEYSHWSHTSTNMVSRQALACIDDETKLKLRVEQQLDVICSLKCEVTSRDKDNETMRSELEKIEESSSQLNVRLAQEQKAKDILRDRFDTLAANHNEMIELMKGYKRESKQLRQSLSSKELELSLTHKQCLQTADRESEEKSKEIQKLQIQIANLEETNSNLSEQGAELKRTVISLSNSELLLKSELESARKDSDVRALHCENKVDSLNRLKEKTEIENMELKKELKSTEAERNNIELRSRQLEEQLSASNTDLEISRIEVRECDEKRRAAENRFKSEAEKVNRDLQVSHLREELDKVKQEYTSLESKHQSYKQYANELLEEEKEINKKLKRILS